MARYENLPGDLKIKASKLAGTSRAEHSHVKNKGPAIASFLNEAIWCITEMYLMRYIPGFILKKKQSEALK